MIVTIMIDVKRKNVKQSSDKNGNIIIRCNNVIKCIEYAIEKGIYDDKTTVIVGNGSKQLFEYFR